MMKMRTGTLLVACFAIVTLEHFGTSVEVSSKIDLDSNETEETSTDSTVDGKLTNNFDNSSESTSHRRKLPTRNWRHGSGFVRPRKRRIFPLYDSPGQPKIINNIQIVLNGNDTVPEENSCGHGVRNVSVSSKADEEGNIVTEVHLSIITSVKPGVKIDEVPVIDGFRGVGENDEQPIFQPIHTPDLVHLHPPRENIPQIQSNDQGEPLYHRRTFQRPQTYWNYRNYGDRDNAGFRGRKTWTRERPVVDDKIEPPLSQTKFSDD